MAFVYSGEVKRDAPVLVVIARDDAQSKGVITVNVTVDFVVPFTYPLCHAISEPNLSVSLVMFVSVDPLVENDRHHYKVQVPNDCVLNYLNVGNKNGKEHNYTDDDL